jgi:orotate phosphoribosyltransferase
MTHSLSAHTFADLESASFPIADYSALKFGSDRSAKRCGHELAEAFYAEHRRLLQTQRCVVIPSAFNVVEIAATILARHFMNRLNDLLTRGGYPIVEWTTMHRSMSYIADYAHLPKEKRAELLKGDRLYLNRDYIEGKTLIFVDDVKITGTHEDKIVAFLAEEGITNERFFAYYARYQGERADIEAALNHAGICTLDDYIRLVSEPNHHLVVRAIRFLLDVPLDVLLEALPRLPPEFIEKLYLGCLAKEYDKQDGYRIGFEAIRRRHDLMEAKAERMVA